MTLRTTLKQMLRTPFKTLLFFLLLALSTAALTIGLSLFLSNQENERNVNEQYTTVGTIEQMPDSSRNIPYEVDGQTYFYTEPEYLAKIPGNAFDGLPTKLPVENRPVLYIKGTRTGGEPMVTPTAGYPCYVLVFTPDQDYDPADSVHQVINGYLQIKCTGTPYTSEGPQARAGEISVTFYPDMLGEGFLFEQGKTYAALCDYSLRIAAGNCVTAINCRWLVSADESSVEYDGIDQIVFPYEEGFLESETGKKLLAFSDSSQAVEKDTFLAVPTNGLELLSAFRSGKAAVKEGRAITEEEFASGAKVCMLPEKLMRNIREGDRVGGDDSYSNYLQVGDKIGLSTLGKVYGVSPSTLGYSSDVLYAVPAVTGSPQEELDLGEYEIVGSYAVSFEGYGETVFPPDAYRMTAAMSKSGFPSGGLGYYEVIFPTASADLSGVPILYGSHLIADNTSFQLQNGTATEFLDAFHALGYDMLQVTLDDQGYTAVKKGLDAVNLVALILLFAGAVSSLSLLIFFVYLQISRQKRETAVQVSLGAGKRRCAAALLFSVLFLAVLGAAAGAFAGQAVTETLARQVYEQAKGSGYSREFSDQMDSSNDLAFTYDAASHLAYPLLAVLSVSAAALLLSAGFAWRVLRLEPLKLLSQREKE